MKTVSLGDICDVIGGGTPSKDNAAFYRGDIPWATVRDMRSETIDNTEFKITEDAIQKSSTNVIPKGNVVIATRVGLGKVCFLSHDTAINQDLRGIIPKSPENLDVRFLFWWFQSTSHLIVKAGTGATVQGVKLPFVKSLQIPVFSIPEQKRIVAILDEAFAGIDKAIVNTQQNLANARELFESYLNTIFTQKGDGWVEKKLGDICEVIGGGTPSKSKPAFYGGDIPWATVRDMRQEIISDTELKITREAVKSSSTNVIPKGNVIIATRVGLGKVCFISQDTAINQDLRGIVPRDANTIDVHILFWWFKSISHLIVKEGTGATVQGVKLPFVKSLSIPIPPLPEQKRIAEQLDMLREKTQRLEDICQQKLTALAELKQSLLQKAFSGELTADDLPIKKEVAA